MNDETIVIALGGNALQAVGEAPTIANQIKNIEVALENIIDLIQMGNKVIITHGNGPQVGRILLKEEMCDSYDLPASDLDICDAMSQASIGICIQQVLESKLKQRNINRGVVCVLTEVLVDENDEAFLHPTKPIGPYYDEVQAKELEETKGYKLVKTADGKYRRVVGSPKPQKILQLDSIKTLVDQGYIVICCGGGGVPVIEVDNHYQGIGAVIDKDMATSLLAQELNADKLVILTAVSNVYINYNTPNQMALTTTNVQMLEDHLDEFEKGSMLPKVQSCINFTTKTGNISIITDLSSVYNALTTHKSGTIIM